MEFEYIIGGFLLTCAIVVMAAKYADINHLWEAGYMWLGYILLVLLAAGLILFGLYQFVA